MKRGFIQTLKLIPVIVFTALSIVGNVYAAGPPSAKELNLLNKTNGWYDDTAVENICTTAGNVAVEPGENKRAAFLFFVAKGLTPSQSAGFVGNLEAESGVNPDISERNPIVAGSRGGYGIAQWTGGRRVAIETYASQNGQVLASLEFQLNYLWNEELLKGYKNTVLDPLKATTTIQQASDVVLTKFEIPKVIIDNVPGPVATLKGYRAGLGQKIFELYGSEAATPGAPNAATVSTACGGSGEPGSFVGFPLQTTKARMDALNGGCFQESTKKMCQGGHPYAAYDIMADTGTPVLSILDGTVQGKYTDRCGGTMISVYSAAQDVTVSYLHLAPDLSVANGDIVTAGQTLAKVGTTGHACNTGAHLHIDAAAGKPRPGCSRLSCPATNANKFIAGEAKISLGSSLYEGYSKLQ